MSESIKHESFIEAGRVIMRSRGINFSTFQERIGPYLAAPMSADSWVELYNSMAIDTKALPENETATIKHWLKHHGTLHEFVVLSLKIYQDKNGWIKSKEKMPADNIGVLVFIPAEDGHITSGMWDVSKKWVLLDDYRKPKTKVTHWWPLPEKPIK